MAQDSDKDPRKSVCKILFDDNATGSGFFVDRDLVITCAHGVRETNATIVWKRNHVRGDLIALDTYKDRAMLRLREEVDVIPLKIRTEALPKIARLSAIGYAGEFEVQLHNNELFGRVNKGFSGGPIVDDNGNVVGVLAGMTGNKLYNLFDHGQLKHWFNDYKDNDIIKNIRDFR